MYYSKVTFLIAKGQPNKILKRCLECVGTLNFIEKAEKKAKLKRK